VAALRSGSVVASYRIERLLGRGGMGEVYLARDSKLDRWVALKVLTEALGADATFRDRFLRESRLAASIDHQNIIPIYEAGDADGLLFIAMRYVEGRDLGRVVADEGALAHERAVELVGQIAAALDAAHERGLVHRDVKPANVLVAGQSGQEHCYLCDFGLSRGAGQSAMSVAGGPTGTPDYMAPEQIEGGNVDRRVDVYSLGCVLVECLTGTVPYPRDSDLASLWAHANDPPPWLRERQPDLPEALESVVQRALAKDPEDRYQSCGELAAAARGAIGATSGTTPPPLQTFLFCDIRGYTAYTNAEGDEAGAALAAQFATLVRDLAGRSSGVLREIRGDEALVVFGSARQALRFAMELQAAAADLPRGIGIGLDAGEAVPVAGGFRGSALNRAARLCALAGAGQVLASETVVRLAGQMDGVTYGERKLERLKGFDERVALHEVSAVAGSPPRRRRRARRLVAVGVAMAAVAVAAALAAVLTTRGSTEPEAGGPPPATPAAEPAAVEGIAAGSVAALSSETGRPTAQVPGLRAIEFIAGEDALWALEPNLQFLVGIDAESGSVTDRLAVDAPARFLDRPLGGTIWYTSARTEEVVGLDVVFKRESARIALPNPSASDIFLQTGQGITSVDGELWVTYGFPVRLARIDPDTGEVVRTWRLRGARESSTLLTAGDGAVWAVADDGSSVWRLDPATGDVVARGALAEGSVAGAVVAEGYLWVAFESGSVWKVDEQARPVTQIRTGESPWALVSGEGSLWVSNANSGTVTRIDPRTEATEDVEVGHRPLGLAVVGGALWIGVDPSATEARTRIEGDRVLTAAVAADNVITDPAVLGDFVSQALHQAIGARLYDYRPTPDGRAAVVPDVATDFPEVSADGVTYTIRVRPGFRFSPPSDEEVTAEAFRHSIERALSPTSGSGYCRDALLPDVEGLDAFVAGDADSVSGLVANGDELTITLTAPSATLPARLASPCFSVVPDGTPVVFGGLGEPIPSAGPLYMDVYTFGEQLTLVRNPNYAGSKPQELDGIVLRVVGDPERAATLVERGEAHYAFDDETPASPAFAFGGRLEEEYGECEDGESPCFVRPPSSGLRFLLLNTHRGFLADANVRRALSLAVDRAQLAEIANAEPRTRILGPGIPGYAPDPLVPASGDAEAARRLLDGGSGKLVVGAPSFAAEAPEVARALEAQLGAIGIEADVRLMLDPYSAAAEGDTALNALYAGWAPDFADGHSALKLIASPRTPGYFYPPWFTDEAALDAIDEADATTGDARADAWRAVDERLSTEEVPLVPLFTLPGVPQLFGADVGCQVYMPPFQGLVDLSGLCLE
jgi:ABC-type transport system substrate-binding protein/class 3 adenylate cyclase